MAQWTFDSNHWSFDDNTFHTWDGWHGDTGSASIPEPLTATKELRADDEIIMDFVREYMKRV